MTYELEPAQIEEINSKLPPQFIALKDKYPQTIFNIARYWDLPAYTSGYIPEYIDIFYEDDNFIDPAITIKNENLTCVELEDPVVDPKLIYMAIEDDPAYVQVEGRVIFNRLGGTVLPEVLIDVEVMLRAILNGISV